MSHCWFGHCSAVFLEFGKLRSKAHRDGNKGNPIGDFGVMIEWGWRLEGRKTVLCGCWSDQDNWTQSFDMLCGTSLASASLTGRLPELDLCFSNDMHCVSFMIERGNPQWAIFDRRSDKLKTLISRKGTVDLKRSSRSFKS